MKKIKYIIILLFILLSFKVFAQQQMIEAPAIYYFTPRVFSMGGAYTAWGQGPDAFFYNPAAYGIQGNRHLFLLDPSLRANFTMLNLFNQIMQSQNDFSVLMKDPEFVKTLIGLRLSIGFSGLPFAGLMIGGIGVAVFDSFHVTANIKKGLLVPDAYLNVNADIGAIVGMAFNVGPFIVGANVKLLFKLWGEEKSSILNLLNYSPSQGTLPIALYKGSGLGFDVGAIMKLGNLQLGLTVMDIFTRLSYWKINSTQDLSIGPSSKPVEGKAYIKPQLNFGVAYKVGTLLPLIAYNVVLTADIQNINQFIEDLSRKNYYTLGSKLFMGTEIQSFGIFKFRFGLMQGYPTFGITINLLILQISLAYYSRELSPIPGLNQEENLLINLSFIW
ncbi:MAG: conjugal transfer protein TraF [Spirochaetes bacterium]|nr:conjugal transfer protein TraF [Spirochaetota bacterium]